MSAEFETIKGYWKIEIDGIRSLEKTIDKRCLQKAIQLLSGKTGTLFFTGCGTSAMAARKVAHTFSCVERPACFLNPSDAVHGALGLLNQGDMLIFFSKGGTTAELLPIMDVALKKQIKTIVVSENETSSLVKNSHLYLKVKVEREPDPFNMLATASTLATISLFDGIAIQVMQNTGFTQEQFHKIHPGGAVGERLKKNMQ